MRLRHWPASQNCVDEQSAVVATEPLALQLCTVSASRHVTDDGMHTWARQTPASQNCALVHAVFT
jgi:hypothetical protein